MNRGEGDSPRHPIRVVARRTGLTPAVLRAWEKRYGVVVPARADGGQRLYSDNEVSRLSLLLRAVKEGRSISQVASMPTQELRGLVREDGVERRNIGITESLVGPACIEVLETAQRAVDEMDPEGLERILARGALAFPILTVIDDIVVPLLSRIRTGGPSGRVGAAREDLAIVVIRGFLEWVVRAVDVGEGAPVLVAATVAGEGDELGALLSVVSGAVEGWKGLFLGPRLPAEEIAATALRLEAEVVTLFCAEPLAAQALPGEIMKLRRRLPADVHLLVGGPLAVEKEMGTPPEGVTVLPTLAELRASLRELGSSR